MKNKKTEEDYWFTIEPYVYIGLTNKCVLLYNTLDGEIIESDEAEILELLHEVLRKDNYGVILLTRERFLNKNINAFIMKLRQKYMGDVIGISLSSGRPVQLLPFFNFDISNKFEIYKKHNFYSSKDVLKNVFEISVCVNNETEITKLIPFLQSAPAKLTFNIIGNIRDVVNYSELLSFFDQHSAVKNIVCPYTDIPSLSLSAKNKFSYRILIRFPIDLDQWAKSRQILRTQTLPYIYIFEVVSEEDYRQAEQIIENYQIKKYQIQPVYTGRNIDFFEKNVFLTKEDILSIPISIKNIFANQSVNFYDFGKINIASNGDVYANVNYPVLGNIATNNIQEIVQKEVDEGKSWFRIRTQTPCSDCVYQWLCPPLSDYEIVIGRPNLCHVKKYKDISPL